LFRLALNKGMRLLCFSCWNKNRDFLPKERLRTRQQSRTRNKLSNSSYLYFI